MVLVHHTLGGVDHSWVVDSNQQSALSEMGIDRHKDGVDRWWAIVGGMLEMFCSNDRNQGSICRCLEFVEILRILQVMSIVALTGVEIDAQQVVSIAAKLVVSSDTNESSQSAWSSWLRSLLLGFSHASPLSRSHHEAGHSRGVFVQSDFFP